MVNLVCYKNYLLPSMNICFLHIRISVSAGHPFPQITFKGKAVVNCDKYMALAL